MRIQALEKVKQLESDNQL